MERWTRWVLLAYAVLVLGTALVDVRPRGDCGEYILMARAFASRGAPDLRDADAYWLARREPRLAGVASLLHRAQVGQWRAAVGSVRTDDGRYYSIHFWFYSLLAAPALILLETVRGPPLLALTFVNAAAALTASAYLMRCFRGSWLAFAAPAAFLCAGTTFYLAFTGPEALTASAVLIAWLAAGRGELGIGFLAAGVAATQNPTASALFPFIAVETWRLRREASPAAARPLLTQRTLELAGAGVLLALSPYIFYWVEYGVPSLIGQYSTDFKLIGFERAWSFFFDLNQGLAPCLPGVVLALALLLASSRWSRARWLRVAATFAVVLTMALPTCAAPNWNAGSVVLMRYAYWIAMPLLVLVLELAVELRSRRAVPAVALLAATQAGVLVSVGFRGGNSSYLRHDWLARVVLARAPSAYDPVIEIFVERTLGRERSPRPSHPLAWPRHGRPSKILVHESARPVDRPECPTGSALVPASTTRLAGGWRYENGPFRCAATKP
jgi:hypothetical protein